MTDDLRRRVERSTNAERLLKDPLFRESVELTKQAYIELWQQTGDDQADMREEMFRRLKAIDKVLLTLHTFLRDGKKASAKIKELERGDAQAAAD